MAEQKDSDEKGAEDPIEFFNNHETIQNPNFELEAPTQPISSFTRDREEELTKSVEIDVDYLRYTNSEDLTVALLNGAGKRQDMVGDVLEADNFEVQDGEIKSEETDEIFQQLAEGLECAINPSNTLFARFPTTKAGIDRLDNATKMQLASIADHVGANIYVEHALLADSEIGGISPEMIDDYLSAVEERSDRFDDMTFVPVIHLTDVELTEAKLFAQKVDERFSDVEMPFIGVTGNSPFTDGNKPSFLAIRNSSKHLLVSQCGKKIRGKATEQLGAMSLQQSYAYLGAKVVLEKRSLNGGSSEGIDVMKENSPEFEATTVEEATSSIADLSFEQQRDEFGVADPGYFTNLHNELTALKHMNEFRKELQGPEQAAKPDTKAEEVLTYFRG